jgi:cytochrome c-type biogenesis protein CcmF
LWAYDELGWGGYWGWDPVENASLLPWLAAFALIHFVPKNTTRLDRPAVVFAGLGFGSTILASYLTRSGVVISVHGFADGSFSWIWLIPLGLVVLGTAVRAGKRPAAASSGSRLILVTGLLFLVIALAVLAGTLWPVLGRLFIVKPQPLRPEFYNSVVGMLGLGLLGVLAGCALRRFGSNRRKIFIGAVVVGLAACVGVCVIASAAKQSGIHDRESRIASSSTPRNDPGGVDAGRLIAVFLIAVNMFFPLIEIFQGHKNPWPGLPRNLAHLGVAILAAGLTASMVQVSAPSLVFKKGQTRDLGSIQVTLQKLRLETPANDRFDVVADLIIRTGRKTIELHPRHSIWSDNRRRVEIDFHSGLFRDFYATLDNFDESHAALITVRENWLVSWVWAGAALILAALAWAGMRGRRLP